MTKTVSREQELEFRVRSLRLQMRTVRAFFSRQAAEMSPLYEELVAAEEEWRLLKEKQRCPAI